MTRNFLDYKQQELNRYNRISATNIVIDLDAKEFYHFSFYNRKTAELDYKLLDMLVKVEDVPEAIRNRAKYYLLSGAQLLARDAEIADNTAEKKNYDDKIAQLTTIAAQQASELTGWQQSVARLHQDIESFLSVCKHISKFITLLSYMNLYRLVTVFSRLSFKFFWNLASERHWLDAQNTLFGIPVQRTALELPANFLNFLSVALFAARLLAHGAMIIKHARSEREGEKDIPYWDRVMKEFSARMINIMNDLAWVIINLLTNYAAYWHIADPLANTLLALALAWDCIWLGIHLYREERDWGAKERELIEWQSQCQDSYEVEFIIQQLKVLSDLRLEARAKYLFMIAAGLSITTAYLIFLAQISALVSTLCLVICVLGFAMYGSADEFGAMIRVYFGKMEILDERATAVKKFLNTFTQTLLPPFVMMGLLSFGWQVALLAAIAAVAYAYIPANLGLGGKPPPPANEEVLFAGTAVLA